MYVYTHTPTGERNRGPGDADDEREGLPLLQGWSKKGGDDENQGGGLSESATESVNDHCHAVKDDERQGG